MGQFPSTGGSGGSSAIYEDGEPVSVGLGNNEFFSPPAGETWVGWMGAGDAAVTLDGGELVPPDETNKVVLTSDDSVQAGGNSDGTAAFTGWSI